MAPRPKGKKNKEDAEKAKGVTKPKGKRPMKKEKPKKKAPAARPKPKAVPPQVRKMALA